MFFRDVYISFIRSTLSLRCRYRVDLVCQRLRQCSMLLKDHLQLHRIDWDCHNSHLWAPVDATVQLADIVPGSAAIKQAIGF